MTKDSLRRRRRGTARRGLAGLAALLAAAAGAEAVADGPTYESVVRTVREHHPTFSFDGRLVAYTSNRRGNDDVFVEPLDGSEPPRAVTTGPSDDRFPSFSPDGRSIAFQSNRNGTWDVFVIEIGAPDDSARLVAGG